MIPTLACTANKIYALETENLKVGIKMLKEEKGFFFKKKYINI